MVDAGYRMSNSDEELVLDTMLLFDQMQLIRSSFASQWQEIAQLIWPAHANTFFFGNYNMQGVKKTERQIDATGMLANHKFGAICDSLLTPRNQEWHQLAANDPYVMKDRATQLWFEQTGRSLFDERYAPHGNFTSQNQQNYRGLGAFGTMGLFIDEFDGRPAGNTRGIRYMAVPLGELYLTQNHQGLVDGVVRWFRLTGRQAWQRWGNKIPEAIRVSRDKGSEQPFDFLHRVWARTDDYDPTAALTPQGKPWGSCYIAMTGRCLLQHGGYYTFPYSIGRYEQGPGEFYGRSPAMMVLPALKSLNDMKVTSMKVGHRNADPVLLTTDDGLVDPTLRPGTFMKGGMSSEGRRLIDVLPNGNYEVSVEQRQEEATLINDAFLVNLFQILTETPQMTATEVIERTNEKGILLAPTVGRQQSEYLGPLIDRELDILSRLNLLPPMPPRLREAQGSYKVVYTSPLSRAMRAQEAAGFMRTLEVAHQVAAATGDASVYDPFNLEVAIPQVAEINGVKPSWMATPQEIAQKKQARAKAQQQQMQVQAAPAQAAMMKAETDRQSKMMQQAGPA
jgi:hypothetical protein